MDIDMDRFSETVWVCLKVGHSKIQDESSSSL